MKAGARYKVPRRRRREGKTNYRRRYVMVLSGRIRFVVRRTNKYIDVKLVKADPKGDITLVSAHSIELFKKFGWKGGTKSTPASYLTGYLAGLRAVRLGIKEATADIGLHRPVRGARVFAAIKGAIDAGLKIPASEEVFPEPERIRGEHIAEWAARLEEENPELLKRRFSVLLSRGFHPKGYPSHFEEVLNRIKASNGA
uniref:Large ribosomal subunit protein uL18 n=1 Tax=Fervidicoccus fontis TaxID=683846 RepID=A0A7J3ZKH1_9CREN